MIFTMGGILYNRAAAGSETLRKKKQQLCAETWDGFVVTWGGEKRAGSTLFKYRRNENWYYNIMYLTYNSQEECRRNIRRQTNRLSRGKVISIQWSKEIEWARRKRIRFGDKIDKNWRLSALEHDLFIFIET